MCDKNRTVLALHLSTQHIAQIWDTWSGKYTQVPAWWYQDPVMNSLSGLSESQCKQRSVVRYISRCFPWFLHQIVIKNNKQISENLTLVCVNLCFWYISLLKYARDSTNFVSILFLLQKNLWFLRKPRWCGYPGTCPEITYLIRVQKYPYISRPRYHRIQIGLDLRSRVACPVACPNVFCDNLICRFCSAKTKTSLCYLNG